MSEIEKIIEDAWGEKEDINQNSEATIINSINQYTFFQFFSLEWPNHICF